MDVSLAMEPLATADTLEVTLLDTSLVLTTVMDVSLAMEPLATVDTLEVTLLDTSAMLATVDTTTGSVRLRPTPRLSLRLMLMLMLTPSVRSLTAFPAQRLCHWPPPQRWCDHWCGLRSWTCLWLRCYWQPWILRRLLCWAHRLLWLWWTLLLATVDTTEVTLLGTSAT